MSGDGARISQTLARTAAVLAAAGLVCLWGMTAWQAVQGATVPSGSTPTGPPALLAFGIFASLAVAAAVAAVRDAPLVTVVAALVSLVPVGLWMLLAPGAGRWIGALDLVMLGAGIVLLRTLGRERGP